MMKYSQFSGCLVIGAVSLLVSMSTQATNKRDLIEYKCHFELAGKPGGIVVVRLRSSAAVHLDLLAAP